MPSGAEEEEEAFYMLLPANKSDRMCHLVAITMLAVLELNQPVRPRGFADHVHDVNAVCIKWTCLAGGPVACLGS